MTILQSNHPVSLNTRINNFFRKLEVCCVFILFTGFFDFNFAVIAGSVQKVFYNASYVIIFFLIIMRWKRCVYVATRDVSLLLLVGMALASYFWSASPEYTAIETKSYIRSVLIGIYIASRYNPLQLFPLYTGIFGVSVVLNLLFSTYAVFSGNLFLAASWINGELSWTGLLTHKQYLGRMMIHAAIILLLSAFTTKKFRWVKLIVFIWSVFLLLLTKSKTAWSLLIFSFMLLPILRLAKWKYKLQTMLYLIVGLVIGLTAVFLVSNYEMILVDILKKPPDFNGRFDIWFPAIDIGLNRPWLGYGYAGFWTSNYSLPILNGSWALTQNTDRFHAHNGFIDIFLQFGIIGFSLFAFNFVAVTRRVIELIHLTKTIASLWMLEFLFLAATFQIFETLTLMSLNTLCSIYVSIVLSTVLWLERIKRNYSWT